MPAGKDVAVQGPVSDQLQRAGLERRLQDLGATEQQLQVTVKSLVQVAAMREPLTGLLMLLQRRRHPAAGSLRHFAWVLCKRQPCPS